MLARKRCRPNDQLEKIIQTERRHHLKSTVDRVSGTDRGAILGNRSSLGGKPDADGCRRLAPVFERMGGTAIGRVTIDPGHACLVLDGPGRTGKALAQPRLDVFLDRFVETQGIEIDDVDVIERRRLGVAMQVIPDTISNEARCDPAIRKLELTHRDKDVDHGLIGSNEIDEQVFSGIGHARRLTILLGPVQGIFPGRHSLELLCVPFGA